MDSSVGTAGPLRVAIIIFGFLGALAAGTLALFTIGETYALATAMAILVSSWIIAFTATALLGRVILGLLVVTFAGSLTIGGLGAVQVLAALAGDQSGPVDPADPDELAAAEIKIDQSVEDTTFRVELTESELNAVLQDALAEVDTPFQRITVDIMNDVGAPALIGFNGDFKNGRLTVEGELTADTAGGQLELELLKAEVGMFTMPGVARDAVEDMIGRVADLNRALAEEGADVQDVVIGNNAIVVTGITNSDSPIDAEAMLAAFGNLDGLGIAPVQVPEYEPGVEATSAEGDTYFVALGDSLAAAVGVPSHADGYVAKVHRQVSLEDGMVYGLRNFGRTGETSGTMLLGDQLEDAMDFGRENEVAYVSIDIGANDLLGHLASTDCSEDVEAMACAGRIEASLRAYRQNIRAIFEEVEDGFPEATVVFLLAYNPFSLGFENEVTFEAQSNEVLAELNAIASSVAAEYEFLVADGFTPMRGTTTATTHMTDTPPDIHPNAIGYNVLTAAVLEALG